ncbi:MAG: FeoB small GTPase domain-containing protein [Lachnospiraceae bacterium]
MKRIALAGNPNSGKTTLFNSLTGATAHVGNWPGVTVDKREGVYKKCAEALQIVDLPGIYSLSPYTPEEVISRNFILDEKPDCIINIVDATNLERNLYLTTQLMEIDVPIVVALNMMDAVRKNGDSVDGATLEKKIGLPVVEISALRGEGISRLMEKTYAASKSKRSGVTVLEDCALGHLIGDVKIALEGQKVENPLFHAVKLAEEDELETKAHPDAVKTVRAFKDTFRDNVFGDDFEALVADSRYKYITKHFSSAFRKGKGDEGRTQQVGQSGQGFDAQNMGHTYFPCHFVRNLPSYLFGKLSVSGRTVPRGLGIARGHRFRGRFRRRRHKFARRDFSQSAGAWHRQSDGACRGLAVRLSRLGGRTRMRRYSRRLVLHSVFFAADSAAFPVFLDSRGFGLYGARSVHS